MKALLIDPASRELTEIELNGIDEASSIIGFDTIIADAIDGTTDKLHFDEDCFIRGTEGRFQLDSLPPVAGKALVVGESDVTELTVTELESRVKFL